MNKENVDFLKERLYFLGFSEKLDKELETKIAAKEEKFTLSYPGEFGKEGAKKTVNYDFDFSKSKEKDMYFLNNFTATLNPGTDKERSQKFFLNNGSGVTGKEAFNLLEGRAVFKSNLTKKPKEDAGPDEKPEKYAAWIQLNFKEKNEHGNYKQNQFHEKWKYDLEKSLGKHPIKELNSTVQKEDLIKSLQKGNLQSVTFSKDGNESKMFVEANPRERNINVYDENMKKQFQGIKQAKSEGKAESQSQGVDGGGADGKNQKENAKAGQKLDSDPPAKARKRKGMSV